MHCSFKWVLEEQTEEKRVKLLAAREVTGLLKKKAELRDRKISDKKQMFSGPTLESFHLKQFSNIS